MQHAQRRHVRPIVVVTLAFIVGCAPARAPQSAAATAAPPTGSVDGTGKTLADLFEGKFAGVTVTRVPGGVKLRVRNASNFDATPADPLYVINDVPINPPDGILTLDPNDVLRIEILKDDASTMVWGQRGANGVVKITTKRK